MCNDRNYGTTSAWKRTSSPTLNSTTSSSTCNLQLNSLKKGIQEVTSKKMTDCTNNNNKDGLLSDKSSSGMPSLLMQAAHSAAQADGVLGQQAQASDPGDVEASQHTLANGTVSTDKSAPSGSASTSVGIKKKGPPLRRGKWTPEEEAYAGRLIQEFKAGLLPLTDGTTLRTFLSKLLNCDPMRISKKFVGSNCIGKQVFRRRTADLNRLTAEQIQRNRRELSDLEQRFLERVQQTNRVKSSGVVGSPAVLSNPQSKDSKASIVTANDLMAVANGNPAYSNVSNTFATSINPPWLQPPIGYRPGNGLAFAAANSIQSRNNAAAAGRAMLMSPPHSFKNNQSPSNNELAAAAQHGGSAGMLAIAELQRRASQNSLLQSLQQGNNTNNNNNNSSANLLAAALVQSGSLNGSGRVGFGNTNGGNESSMDSFLKARLSREQLSQLVRDRGLASSGSLGNLVNHHQRQNSFDALMSLDFQSLQSIDNLANLIQSGSGAANIPESGMKNADFSMHSHHQHENTDLANAQRRLASAASSSRMESLLRNFGSQNNNSQNDIIDSANLSNANLGNFLQSMQHQQSNRDQNRVASGLFGQSALNQNSTVSLANLLRQDSSTALSALRNMEANSFRSGANALNSNSVDDFLSLVAAGDIPHQDPSLLNMPMMSLQQQEAAAKILAHHRLLQHSTSNNSHSALVNELVSRGASLSNSEASLAVLAMAQKRSAEEMTGGMPNQGNPKR